MARRYTLVMDAISVTGAKDLLRFSAPADATLEVIEATITQESDAGDAEAEQLVGQLQRSSTDGTGTAVTAGKLETGDAAFGGTAVSNLTVDTTLSGSVIGRRAFDVQQGYHWLPVPKARLILSPSERGVLRLDKAPADAVTVSAEVTVEEVGG